MTNYEQGESKKAVCWLSCAHGITDIYSGFLSPLMPFIAVKIGFSLAVATMVMSVSQALASTIQPLFGYIADISKKRSLIFWGLILGALSYPLAANVNSFGLLCILILLGNLGTSMFHPQAMGLVPYFSNKNSVYNMSIFVTFGTIGFAFGPIISSSIFQFLGAEKLLFISCIGLVMAFLMFICVPKIQITENAVKNRNIFSAFRDIFNNKTMLILLTMGLMKTLIQSSCSIMMPFLWKDFGYSPVYIGFSMFLFLFAGGIGSLLSHRFEKKLGAKFVFYSSMTITFPLMIVYALTYKILPIFALCVFVAVGFLTAFAQPVTIVMAQKTLPQYKSIVSGIINGFTWGLVAVLLVILGVVAERVGIMEILVTLAILPAIASVLVKYLPDKIEE
ncbi:MFS transporter [bacterium]|nr:MFS transporter [bacterium]